MKFGFGRKLYGLAGEDWCQKAMRMFLQLNLDNKVNSRYFHEGEQIVLSELFLEYFSFLFKGIKF
jgi:hypothetical protein